MIHLPKYKASPELEAWLKTVCGPHYVCDDSKCQIDTLEGLQAFRNLHGDGAFREAAVPVYPYSPDSPFSPEADAAYQAYHDRMHAIGGYQFDIGGEYHLACYHREHALRNGLDLTDALVLFHHVASRVLYHYYHDGRDPPCRATFISACFRDGMRSAARGDYLQQYGDYYS